MRNAASCASARLRAAEACFGHRLMMDAIVPGGVARDIAPDGAGAAARACSPKSARVFPRLIELYDNTASLQDRTVTTGIVQAGLRAPVRRRRLCRPRLGPRLRRAPRAGLCALRRAHVRGAGARRRRRQCAGLDPHPRGRAEPGADRPDSRRACRTATIAPRSTPSGEICEGLGLVEAFRGDVLVWLRLDGEGRVARCHLRDASWFQWPLLEAAIEGNIVADFPLCNKSFNCSYSGHDL